ncbi:Mu transposase C-terminal domain-containing protein [Parvibaculaceae bacterium PLY_AMNH_Bact1]|nr:Mu transposase C-terminal domain-containing protein [Parvibaculaceae bacterium PLY_AMNH_Bact1]
MDWFSSKDLAALKLSAIPHHRSNVDRQAEREGWQWRPREGRGGGREYHLSSLPEAARIELARRSLLDNPVLLNATSRQQDGRSPRHVVPPNGAGNTISVRGSKAQKRQAARTVIINLVRTFKDEGGLSMIAARSAFSTLFNAGEIPVEEWVQDEIGTLSVSSLGRWQSQAAREGAQRLGGKYGTRKGKGQIEGDPQLRDFCIANMAERPHLTANQMIEIVAARFDKRLAKRTVQRFMNIARERYADAFLAAANPDAHKNLRLVAFGSQSEKASAPNAVWEIDASPADIMTTEGRRLNLVAMVDVWTRRAKVLVTPTPKATAATLLMRQCIMDWGVPDTIKMDNGKDFASAHVARALGGLGIQQEFCLPFTPEGKPHVERFFGTLQRDFVSLLPGFIGHNVTDRQAIEARRSFAQRFGDPQGAIAVELNGEELQSKISDWIEKVYHRRTHSALGQSPKLQALSWAGTLSTISNERALDVFLAEAPDTEGLRVVGKKGIRVENALFIAPELGAHVGERVHVRLDPADMGRIMVYGGDHQFICIAEAPERTGISREEVATKAKARQREAVKEAKAHLRSLSRDHKVHNVADEILAAIAADDVLPFPLPTDEHTTAALGAAGEAAAHLDREPEPPNSLSPEDRALAEEAKQALVIPLHSSPEPKADVTDDWTWVQWARAHHDKLTQGQQEYLAELENDPAIRVRDAEASEPNAS